MSVFSHGLWGARVQGTYAPIDRRGPLGMVPGDPVPVAFVIDEGGSENWQKTTAEHASDVLIYGDPESVLGSRNCVGGRITDGSTGRVFRVEGFDVAKNQRTGKINHTELTVSEQS